MANAQGMEAHDGCAGWADEEASETCLAASSVLCPACLSRASMSWCQPSCAARSLVLCALRLLARRLLQGGKFFRSRKFRAHQTRFFALGACLFHLIQHGR